MSLSARTHAFLDRLPAGRRPSLPDHTHPLLSHPASLSPPQQQPPRRQPGTRLRPGTRTHSAFPSSADPFAAPRPLADFDDSPFAVQEYIAELVRRDAHDVEELVRVPVAEAEVQGEERDDGDEGARELIDEHVFCLEHVR
ncbi:hypothetical protein JCM8208_007740, partial [Rhodotorula glutinis]